MAKGTNVLRVQGIADDINVSRKIISSINISVS